MSKWSRQETVIRTEEDFVESYALTHYAFDGDNGHRWLIQIAPDTDMDNPREAYDHLWTWVTTQNAGYSDICNPKVPHNQRSWASGYWHRPDMYEDDEDFKHDNLIVALSLYRHSGDIIYMGNVQPCQWDSGCMGFAFVSWRQLDEAYPNKSKNEQKDKAMQALKAEVDEMNCYISGNVYGIILKDLDEGMEEACWGFMYDSYKALKPEVEDFIRSAVKSDLLVEKYACALLDLPVTPMIKEAV